MTQRWGMEACVRRIVDIIGGYYDAVLLKNAQDNRGHSHALHQFSTRRTNGARFLDWFTAAVTR
jgi:hypothetical protein